jgi:hypothetical protein
MTAARGGAGLEGARNGDLQQGTSASRIDPCCPAIISGDDRLARLLGMT